MDNAIITSLLSLLGVFLGAILSYHFGYKKDLKNRNLDYCVEIYKDYKIVSTEIIEAIMPLTSLGLKPKGFKPDELSYIRENISKLYFKHYIYLPQIVLNEINCLHSCLLTEGKTLFCIKEKTRIEICSEDDVKTLFNDTALVNLGFKKNDNKRDIETYIEKYPLNNWNESLKINLQARRTIRVLSKIFEGNKIEDWSSILKKETLSKKMNNRNVKLND